MGIFSPGPSRGCSAHKKFNFCGFVDKNTLIYLKFFPQCPPPQLAELVSNPDKLPSPLIAQLNDCHWKKLLPVVLIFYDVICYKFRSIKWHTWNTTFLKRNLARVPISHVSANFFLRGGRKKKKNQRWMGGGSDGLWSEPTSKAVLPTGISHTWQI